MKTPRIEAVSQGQRVSVFFNSCTLEKSEMRHTLTGRAADAARDL